MSVIKIKKPNGQYSDVWHYRFSFQGKIYTKTTGTTNKTVAQRIEQKVRSDLLQGVMLDKKPTLSVEQALKKYLDSKAQSSEHHNHETYVKKLLGSKFDKKAQRSIKIAGLDGSKPFHKLTDADIQTLVLERRKAGQKDSTILHELITVSQTVKLIAKLGYEVPKLDIASIKSDSAVKPSGGRLRWLTVAEEKRLLMALSGEEYDFVLALLRTAARHTEISELKWESVDMNKRVIHLYRTKVDNEALIPMSDDLYAVFKRRFAGKREDQIYVFENQHGEARSYKPGQLRTAVKKAQIPGKVTFHTLRHTTASRLAQSGKVTLHDLQQLLGHSSVQTTTLYAHLMPNASIAKAINALQEVAVA
jgi:integrase